MKLKVTKNVFWVDYVLSMMWWWWRMICPRLSCVLDVFFDFQCRVLKGVQKVTETLLLCTLSSFPFPNGLEMSPFTECDMWVTGVLKGIWNSLCRLILKEVNFLREVSHGELKHCQNDARVLKWVQDSLCRNCLEITNFVEGSLPWRFNTVNLKVVSHGVCWGLERSQFEQFSAVYETYRVLKWVYFDDKSQGSWKESIWRGCVHIQMYRGLERSQFAPNYTFPPKGLERSSMHSAESLSGSCFGWSLPFVRC